MSETQKHLQATEDSASPPHPAGAAVTAAGQSDPVDAAGDDSFPCSDPPSWTLGRAAAVSAGSGDAPAAPREVEVASLDGIPDGAVRGIRVEGREIALCKLDEQVYALSGACSYHPIPLDGAKLDGELLTCQWYGAQFDVRTGESAFLRSVAPLAKYPATVRDGRVFVQLPPEPAGYPANRWAGAER